jgi:hypothetical protein
MLLAALVAIWVRRHHREPVGGGPWAVFWAGMAATLAATLAAAQSTPVGIIVARVHRLVSDDEAAFA